MDKHVISKATYLLKLYQPTTQEIGKGGKRRNEFSLIAQNSIFSMHKDVHSKGNLPPKNAPVHNTASG